MPPVAPRVTVESEVPVAASSPLFRDGAGVAVLVAEGVADAEEVAVAVGLAGVSGALGRGFVVALAVGVPAAGLILNLSFAKALARQATSLPLSGKR